MEVRFTFFYYASPRALAFFLCFRNNEATSDPNGMCLHAKKEKNITIFLLCYRWDT